MVEVPAVVELLAVVELARWLVVVADCLVVPRLVVWWRREDEGAGVTWWW